MKKIGGSKFFGTVVNKSCKAQASILGNIIFTCTFVHVRRYSLSADVISFIHKNGCVMFSIKNIERCIEYQPALEVVEMFSTLFCCLKDSADFSQVCVCVRTCTRMYKDK